MISECIYKHVYMYIQISSLDIGDKIHCYGSMIIFVCKNFTQDRTKYIPTFNMRFSLILPISWLQKILPSLLFRLFFWYLYSQDTTHLKISSQQWLRTRVNYTNSKRGSKLTNKGVILAILTLHYGSKLTNKGSFFTLSFSRMTPLLVNFDPPFEVVYSWLLIFKCVTQVMCF